MDSSCSFGSKPGCPEERRRRPVQLRWQERR
jgi:hypothetical protein